MFAPGKFFQVGLSFMRKAFSLSLEWWLLGALFGQAPNLFKNIGLAWLAGWNTLAYFTAAKVTEKKVLLYLNFLSMFQNFFLFVIER